MEQKNSLSKSLPFKWRKIVHYSLVICILLIQITIAGFFYNEFISRKNITFIDKQLKEVQSLENLTDDSRKELINAQDFFQKYVVSKDNQYLKAYFNSVDRLTKNLDSINNFKFQNPNLKSFSIARKNDSLKIEKPKITGRFNARVFEKFGFKNHHSVATIEKI